MQEPLVVEFEVQATQAHAFELWTCRCASWWPPRHTVSGDPAAIVFEPRAGERILERASNGEEHAWGSVIDWEPRCRASSPSSAFRPASASAACKCRSSPR